MTSSGVFSLEVSTPSVRTTIARRPSPWLAMSRAALSRASCSAVEPNGVIDSSPLRTASRSRVNATTPQ